MNQIARRVNSGGWIYSDEVDEICGKLTEVSGLFGNIWDSYRKSNKGLVVGEDFSSTTIF